MKQLFAIVTLVISIILVNYLIAKAVVRAQIQDQEDRDFSYWKGKLIPIYRQMKIKHVENPTTKDELYAPLVEALDGIPHEQSKGTSIIK